MPKIRNANSSFRKKSSYTSLPPSTDFFSTPKAVTPVCNINKATSDGKAKRSIAVDTIKDIKKSKSLKNMKLSAKVTVPPSKSGNADAQGMSKENVAQFPGMTTVKNALANITQKIKGGKPRRMRLQNCSPYVNGAYTTPRRSERIAKQAKLSPIALKMYSPFCIETPGLDDSFTGFSVRRADKKTETPAKLTPRRAVKRALTQHKQLAESLSSAELGRLTRRIR